MLAVLGVATISAQDINPQNVPSNIRTTFEQAYPNASDVEWEMEGQNYKVEFDVNWQDSEVWYSSDGSTVKTETEIKKKDLPQAILATIDNQYATYRVDSIEKTDQNGSVTFEVELEKGWDEEKQLLLDANGIVLNEWND